MSQGIIQYVKSFYDDFVPPWKWEIPPPTKKNKSHYKKTLSRCQTSQYFLAALAIAVSVGFEHSRQLFISSALRKGVPLFILELSVFFILGYLLGLKRFPANYISLVIIRTFTVFEEKFKPEGYNYDVKVLGPSRFGGYWSQVMATPKVYPYDTYARSTGISVIALIGYWVVGRYTKFEIMKYKEEVLVSQTLASSSAALLLVSTFAFEQFPEFKETHLKWCQLWIVLSTTTLVFAIGFLFERLQKFLRGKKVELTPRIEWETFTFMMAFAITLRYLPTIHKELNVPEVLSHKNSVLLRFLIPTDLMNLGNSIYNMVFNTSKEGIV